MKKCPVCDQRMDLWTTAHKNHPFVDNNNYPTVCFTCYHVPKISEQKYDKNGNVAEDIPLAYSCENLCTAKELHDLGAADSLRQAKNCVEAVAAKCSKAKVEKKPKIRPAASWNIE